MVARTRTGLLTSVVVIMAFLLALSLAGCGGGGDGGGGGGGPTTASLKVVNYSTKPIDRVYVSLSSSSSWGADQCSTTISSLGGTWTLTNITPGTYDFQAWSVDDLTYWQRMSVSLSAGGTITWNLY